MNTANNQNSEHSVEVSLEQLFRIEVARKLGEMGIRHSTEGEYTSILKCENEVGRIYDDGQIAAPVEYVTSDEYLEVKKMVSLVKEYCREYAKAQPLAASGLEDKYRCLAELNDTVLAARHTEYGFEFVVWQRTFDGKGVFQGHYTSSCPAAKEDFAKRSGLVDTNHIFSEAEMKNLLHCIEFTLDNDMNMKYSACEEIKALKERIGDALPEPSHSPAPDMSM